MATTRPNEGEGDVMQWVPDEATNAKRRSEGRSGWVDRLRSLLREYAANNRKDWKELVESQARDPSLD